MLIAKTVKANTKNQWLIVSTISILGGSFFMNSLHYSSHHHNQKKTLKSYTYNDLGVIFAYTFFIHAIHYSSSD